jgi:hypothetical protein
LISAVFVIGAVVLLAPRLIGRNVTLTELTAMGFLAVAIALWSRLRSSKRQRERLDQIRDSALW